MSIKGQTRSKKVKFLQSKIYSQNMPFFSSFVSGFQKYDSLRTAFRNARKHISKKWRHHLYLFYHYTAKYKDIALKFGMCVVCMYVYNIYCVFLDNSKIVVFISIYFWKAEILSFRGQKRTISKIRDSQIVGRSILRLLAFTGCVLL